MSDYTPSLAEARDRYSTPWHEPADYDYAKEGAEFDRMIEAVRAEERERIVSALIGPQGNLDLTVRAFKAGWHHADSLGRAGERVAEGLRVVVAARIREQGKEQGS